MHVLILRFLLFFVEFMNWRVLDRLPEKIEYAANYLFHIIPHSFLNVESNLFHLIL